MENQQQPVPQQAVPAPPEQEAPPFFPNDLAIQCMSRLPVRTLFRFRGGCRGWNSLIVDPNFVRLHLGRSPSNRNLVAHQSPNDDTALVVTCFERIITAAPFTMREIEEEFRVSLSPHLGRSFFSDRTTLPLTSCNGVLCLVECIGRRLSNTPSRRWLPEREFRIKKWSQHAARPSKKPRLANNRLAVSKAPMSNIIGPAQGYRVLFLNPATKMISQESPFLECNIRVRENSIGFGYDVVNHTYKVVVVYDIPSSMHLNTQRIAQVYTMGANQWRIIQMFPAIPVHNNHSCSTDFLKDNAYLNGTLNWVATTLPREELFIVSLNLTSESFSQKRLPQGLSVSDITDFTKTHIGVLKDKLSFSYYLRMSRFVIWRLEEFERDDTWTLLASITLEHLPMPIQEHQQPFLTLMPLNMSEESDVLILVRTCHNGDLIFYNCMEEAVVGFQNFPANLMMRWMDDSNYTESLVSPMPMPWAFN